MKDYLNPHHIGLALGLVVGGLHIAWSLLVYFGLAEILITLILSLHFLDVSFSVSDFDVKTAVMLVVVTFCIGYCVGAFFSLVVNRLMEKK